MPTLLGLKQLRSYVGKGLGQQMLELLIEEGGNEADRGQAQVDPMIINSTH